MIKVGAINKISADIILKKLNSKIDNASAVLVNEIKRVSFDYIPYRSGALAGIENNDKGERYEILDIKEGNRYTGISYTAPYASYVWYGKPNWKYTAETHPNACPRWVLRAFELYKDDILQKVIKEL